jgi:hypothetical protein
MPPRNILHFPIPESIVTSSSYDCISDALQSVLLSIEDTFVEEHGPVQEDQAQASSSMTQSYAAASPSSVYHRCSLFALPVVQECTREGRWWFYKGAFANKLRRVGTSDFFASSVF